MPNKEIHDRNSFGQRLGLMYRRWVLDCIPHLGHAVSLDFSHRPELYKRVDMKTAGLLTDMQSQYGYAPNFPNDETRLNLLKPIFGLSDGQKNSNGLAFHQARKPVLTAAAGFAENAQPTAFPMHRERIRSAIVPLRRFMEDLEGASFGQTHIRIGSIFSTAEIILKDPGVCNVFGINEAIATDWPLDSTNPEGAKLVEKVTTQLTDLPYGNISRDKFIRLQRIAIKGFESISGILEANIESDDDVLDKLTAHLYAWGSELGLIGGAHPQ